jgi:hypothetical protein
VAQKAKDNMTFFRGTFGKCSKTQKNTIFWADLDLRKHRLSKKILKNFLLPPGGPKSQK